jgi:hypothetical protein
MTLLLHGIGPAEPHSRLQGLRQQPLARIAYGVLAAYATRWADASRELVREDLLGHHALVEALHLQMEAFLPARLSAWFEDEAALRSILEQRQPDYSQALERIRNRVELAITALPTAAPEPVERAKMSGTEYLRQRQVTRRLAQTVSAEIRHVLEGQAIEVQESIAPRAGVVLSMAVLTPRAQAADVAERLEAAVVNLRDVRILVNGPWPPYTFAVVQAREA